MAIFNVTTNSIVDKMICWRTSNINISCDSTINDTRISQIKVKEEIGGPVAPSSC